MGRSHFSATIQYFLGPSWSEVTIQLPDNSSGIKITSRQIGERYGSCSLTCSRFGNRSDHEKRQDFFECSTHRKNDEKCKSHYIRAVVLEDMVWMHMETVISYILHYEDHFRAVVQEQLKMESDEKIQAWRKQLTQAEKRIAELDRLFVKIYEDNAKGKLSDERFSMMSGNYEAEQKKLRMDAVEFQKNIEEQDRQNERLEKFIQKAKHYQDLNSLTPDALRDMVSAIYVGAPDKSSGNRQQKIEIYYDGAGFIPLNLLMQRETA